MDKHVTINALLNRNINLFKKNKIEIIDFWEGDLCAIGLKKENKLVYICTHKYVNEVVCRYDYDLEITDLNEPDKLNVIFQGIGVSESELITEIFTFLQ
jgi:hypothetical protein